MALVLTLFSQKMKGHSLGLTWRIISFVTEASIHSRDTRGMFVRTYKDTAVIGFLF